MNKNIFLSRINYDDKNIISSIYEKIQITKKTNKPTYTNEFFPPNVWKEIVYMNSELDISIYSYGIFEECDRRILAFSNFDTPLEYPLQLLKISNKSKFKKLEHKDYLGALMSLGIKREKFGDLILEDETCFVPVCNDISNYVICNLHNIGKCPCEIISMDNELYNAPKINLEEKIIISTSLRLDCVVAAICNISRGKATDFIDGGKVLIDYIECTKKDKTIKNEDILTIRGFGKFKICDVVGVTQKDRMKIVIKKYV